MITKQYIQEFIEKIPPAPKALQVTLMLLNQGELVKASQIAKTDLALKAYLVNLVNKPIYGFKNQVTDVSQIFGILGVSSSTQTVYNYMMTLLSPKKWEMFKLNEKKFYDLQALLSKRWKQILNHLDINNSDIESAITLLPASIIVAEALFKEHKVDVEMLRENHNLDLNTIISRLCGIDLFDICESIATKWDMSENIAKIIQGASGFKTLDDKQLNLLSKWMHLLLFFELSQPQFIEAKLNDFIEFNINYVDDIYEEFATIMEIS